ncbi:hypothetical protein B0H15DRAFT_953377 [Mycena belliarum]|uniref:Uncharacterized protein n=1 Tax=Mycena belliarum TaxID=1033014 RepID=A0AAD6TX77_9AGAR|nr:hypothetical protein B0H15DRAFT_953377 [Mycena belliae]
MLWVAQARQTRAGTVFSPYTPHIFPVACQDLDFASLLADSVAREFAEGQDLPPSDPLEDADDGRPSSQLIDPMNEVDDDHPTPPAPEPWNDIDDESAPPTPAPPKPCRTAFDDMQAGKMPRTGAQRNAPSRSHRNRAERRAKQKCEEGHLPRPSVLRKHVHPGLIEPLQRAVDAATLPAAHGGYTAKAPDAAELWGSKKRRTLDEVKGMGFTVLPWNGFDSRPLVDAQGRVFAVLVGQPRDTEWAAAVNDAYSAIDEEGTAADFPSHMRKHRRGLFAALNVGISYGKGQRVPSRFLHSSAHTSLLNRLLGNPAIIRMANFASEHGAAAFQLWAPRLYNYYKEHDDALRKHLPHLRRNFPRSVFSGAAFNFGNVWTFRHRDVHNIPFGWCGIQAAGPFDASKGGHLIFWDLRLAVEFPHGALILMPSATIAHSNIPVQAGDRRISFTQFTAGGLMRYVDNGFRTDGDLEGSDPVEFERLARLKSSRWVLGLGLFSTLDELLGNAPTDVPTASTS